MGASTPDNVSTKLKRIAELARQMPQAQLYSLLHHMDVEWLHEAYRLTRKDGAVGVDGQTAAEYEASLEENLRSLLDRAKSGEHYRAPPVRRVHIPKGDGRKTRAIGIPTFEDKILQRAVAMALNAVYEQDFLDCSYGFRPGRSAHDALDALWKHTMGMGGGWVLEADIEAFFDSVNREQLQQMLSQRVSDGVLRRLVGKWLRAGVMEEGYVYHPDTGTPQGGVISPILANIYLHEVLDKWFVEQVKPRLRGRAFLIRFADDFVVLFEREEDARRVFDVLSKRFDKYGLKLHPEKTRLVEFRKPPDGPPGPGGGPTGSFDLLGFTHFWSRSRKGNWVVKRKTAASRFSRALRCIGQWCREHRHEPLKEQWKALSQKLRGHYRYYGIVGNAWMLASFSYWVRAAWKKWLGRRNNHYLTWERMYLYLRLFPLPPPRLPRSAKA
jgi:group II intron reverse transcriptase/maturase